MLQRPELADKYKEQLDKLKLPEVPYYAWWFVTPFTELHAGRTFGAHMPNPITWEAIDAWQRVRGRTLSTFQIKVVRRLDDEYLAIIAKQLTRTIGK